MASRSTEHAGHRRNAANVVAIGKGAEGTARHLQITRPPGDGNPLGSLQDREQAEQNAAKGERLNHGSTLEVGKATAKAPSQPNAAGGKQEPFLQRYPSLRSQGVGKVDVPVLHQSSLPYGGLREPTGG